MDRPLRELTDCPILTLEDVELVLRDNSPYVYDSYDLTLFLSRMYGSEKVNLLNQQMFSGLTVMKAITAKIKVLKNHEPKHNVYGLESLRYPSREDILNARSIRVPYTSIY